jgi:hypothetical protein
MNGAGQQRLSGKRQMRVLYSSTFAARLTCCEIEIITSGLACEATITGHCEEQVGQHELAGAEEPARAAALWRVG